MKRDKEWLREGINDLIDGYTSFGGHQHLYISKKNIEKLYHLIDQLDEPEKVVIPQFVADYIDRSREEGYSLYGAFNEMSTEVADWLIDSKSEGKSEGQDTFARAWLDGYEIEKEPLYVVEDNRYCLLCKFDGMVISTHLSESDEIPLEHLDFELTEKEIKSFDKRYWAFAVEVSE